MLLACVKGSAIISAPILISFGGIVSTPMAFLMSISFRSCLASEVVICWKSNFYNSEPNLFLIFNTLDGFDMILSMTSLSFKDPSVVPILLGLFPQLFSAILI